MKWQISTEHAGMTINDYLFNELNFSNRLIRRAKSDGNLILVNGLKQTVRYVLKSGDMLQVLFGPEEKGPLMTPENIPLSIVYEDDHIIVINKQPNLVTIPSRLHPKETVANGLIYYYEQQNLPYTAHIITRLDRETSGLLLIAKHQYSHSLLANSQLAGQIQRKYKAIVHGHLHNKVGEIDEPIGRKPGSIIERMVTEDGKRALTHYKVEKEFGNYSLVNVELKTGRTHQIRVHFSHLGHPLVGDDLYGGHITKLTRQALHCEQLVFTHPFTNETIKINAHLHEDLMSFIQSIEND